MRCCSSCFFCGILTLGYGLVLLAQGGLEHFRLLGLFGSFYTVKFRPGQP